MVKINEILAKFDLGDKEIAVYKALLSLGPSPVRKVGVAAEVNRGTTYDILKNLRDLGLVTYYHKEKHQYFVAEDPIKLFELLRRKGEVLRELKDDLHAVVPQLRSMRTAVEEKPVVTYYDGAAGIRTILQDVLDKVAASDRKEYYVYSSASIKNYLYAGFPEFNEERINRQIHVKVISLGKGGETAGLDERKWLTHDSGTPTYTIIYVGQVAMISTAQGGLPIGLIIADKGLYETQQIIFNDLWKRL